MRVVVIVLCKLLQACTRRSRPVHPYFLTLTNIQVFNFSLFPPARPVPNDALAVSCMHSESECLGNMIELCAADEYPDPKQYLGFTMCLSHHYIDIPQRGLVEMCALEYGMELGRIERCLTGDDGVRGMTLLRRSIERSKSLNVTTSCTIRLNDKVRCVRDGGEWKQCGEGRHVDSLVADINRLYDGLGDERVEGEGEASEDEEGTGTYDS